MTDTPTVERYLSLDKLSKFKLKALVVNLEKRLKVLSGDAIPDEESERVVVDGRSYPSRYTPGQDEDMDTAWQIMNGLKEGVISDTARFFIAGQIIGALMKAREESVLGPTGKFPHGQMDSDDKGEVALAIGRDDTGLVHINFGTELSWIAMKPEDAIALAMGLLEKAGWKREEEPAQTQAQA